MKDIFLSERILYLVQSFNYPSKTSDTLPNLSVLYLAENKDLKFS